MAKTWPSGRSLHGGVDRVPVEGVEGFLWLAGKRFVAPDAGAALSHVQATMVVCLCEEHELAERYPSYVAWLRAQAGRRALWRPVPDLHAPSPRAARGLVGDLSALLRGGESVLMHCGAGIGRAGTVAAALLMELGHGLEAALAVVAASRPGAGPEVGAQSDLLVELARSGREASRGLTSPPRPSAGSAPECPPPAQA